MAAQRLSMRKIKEVLRLRALGQTDRVIAQSLDIGHSTVRRYRERAEEAGLAWPLPAGLSESELEARLFPPLPSASQPRPVPEWKEVKDELRGRRGVTLQLLWLEYKEANPDGYQYSQFCQRYREWKGTLDPVLRQEHRAGEKAFVDYAGQTVPVVEPKTGEIRETQIFVGVLGASNYTYAEATWTQQLPDWTASHVRMFSHFEGVPRALVSDNLRSGVKTACYYDPDVNPTYRDLAEHYGTSVLPTRPRSPRDNAKAEAGVQLVERWILAKLRNHTFFSLTELNEQISRLLDELNDSPFQKLEGSRRSLFETIDRPALQPLPSTRYTYGEWKKARANIDYHIAVDGHFYSVPHRLVRKQVEVRLTSSTLEAFYDGRRIAAHMRSHKKGGFTTEASHRPKSHREYLEWTPSRIVRWASKTGPHTAQLVERILEERPHPEHGYRACLGILRLGDRYSPERLEAACQRALKIRGVSYRSVKSILKSGLDQVPLEEEHQTTLDLPQEHENLRGSSYYTHSTD
jgi:transposase